MQEAGNNSRGGEVIVGVNQLCEKSERRNEVNI